MVNTSSHSIPRWLSRQLNLDDIQAITASIRAAEQMTDGEIVPVIVHRSVITSHLGTICVLALWLIGFAVAVVFERHHNWIELGLGMLAIAGVGVLLGNMPAITRIFTPADDLETCVWQRAQAEFLREGIGRTQRKTGILLFVSMAEHRAVVLADHTIAGRCPPEVWQEVVDLMIKGLKQKRFGSGLCAAIERCGAIIRPHFPKVAGDTNELPDRLVIRE